jgi:hypothetical protein
MRALRDAAVRSFAFAYVHRYDRGGALRSTSLAHPLALALEEARERGLALNADIYPCTRVTNGLDACLPLWVREGGVDAMLARLLDPEQRARIKRENGRCCRR